jgi:hypothetical protein
VRSSKFIEPLWVQKSEELEELLDKSTEHGTGSRERAIDFLIGFSDCKKVQPWLQPIPKHSTGIFEKWRWKADGKLQLQDLGNCWNCCSFNPCNPHPS